MPPPPSPSLGRNAGLNVLTQLAGAAAPLVSIPIALQALGVDRFGILALGWLILGSITTFDLGLGRATTYFTATAMAVAEPGRVARFAAASFAAQLALGLIGGVALAVASKTFVPGWSSIPSELRGEATDTLLVLSAGIPVSLAMGAGRTVLEGAQRFGTVNAIAAPVSIFTYLLAAGGAVLGLSLPAIATLLVLERVVAVGAYFAAIARSGIATPFMWPAASAVRELLGYGRWIAVGSVTAPLVVYADRFIVSGLLGVAALARYSPPFDAITRLWVVPGAVSVALFPYFTGVDPRVDTSARRHYWNALTVILIAIAAPVILLVALGPDLLGAWLGPRFAAEAGDIVPIIAIGVLAGALGYVPVSLIQAAGRPDLSVKLQLAELIPFVGATWLLVGAFGILGAAAAWTVRTVIDLLGNCIMAERLIPGLVGEKARRRFIESGVAVAALAAIVIVMSSALSSPLQRSVVTALAFAVLVALLMRFWRTLREATAP